MNVIRHSTQNKLPDFIISGAGKSGTSTLVAYLRQNKSIYMPAGTGEVHFFNDHPIMHNYNKGINWYKERFNGAREDQIIGEKTPRYSELYVPKRIHEHIPHVKLIWMFRNPVDRAYSHYKMYVWAGLEPLSFEEAIKEEDYRIRNVHSMYNYIASGKYSTILDEYCKHFDKQQMLFLLFEDFIKQPLNTLNQILDFLGIGINEFYSINTEHKLKAKYPKNLKYQIFVRNIIYGKLNGKSSNRPRRICKPIFNFLTKFNLSSESFPRMNSDVRGKLLNYYRPFNEKLGRIINKDLSVWDS